MLLPEHPGDPSEKAAAPGPVTWMLSIWIEGELDPAQVPAVILPVMVT